MGQQVSRRSFLIGKAGCDRPSDPLQLAIYPVKDTMARANNLATAMLVAPFAGITAAVGKYYKLSKTKENNSHESRA